VALLNERDINEANKTNPHALVKALKSFKDFKKDSKYSLTANWARQLVAITTLLEEVLRSADGDDEDNSSLVTKGNLKWATDSIKAAVSYPSVQSASLPSSYATAAHGPASQTRTLPPKPATSPEAQEKDIFISMRNMSKDAPFRKIPATDLTPRLNTLLSTYFRDPKNGRVDMPVSMCSTSHLPNGNVILSFKSKDDTTRARIHADGWVKIIDEAATTPQHTFAVVAHNAPTAIWADPARMAEAIREIEDSNSDIAALEFDIANLAWLNSKESHEKMGRGPLMLSFKSKSAANAAIDYNLAIRGVMCSISIYVPRPLQCFQCQDWGHRVTECIRVDCCGCCAGPHATSQHICIHDNPCPNQQRCNKEPPKCTNCKGDHPSWIHSCPAAKTALAAQTCSPYYHSGQYEAHTPFTFADIARTGPRQQS